MEQAKVCKHNMKLYPIYRMLSFDYLFFYTVNVLFLVQIKNITPSQVMIIDAFYSIFGVLVQIPATFLIEKLSRKKSMLVGDISSAIYLLIMIYSKTFIQLVIAEIFSAFSYAMKDTASPSMLNESIPETKRKSEIFGKINGKAMFGYYILNSISMIISGYLYEVNGYIPMYISLGIILLTCLISNLFYNPIPAEKKDTKPKEKINFKQSLKFIFSSGRIKSLILYSSAMVSLMYILASNEVYLIEKTGISSKYIGIIFATTRIVAAISAKKQNIFHNKFKNKSLTILAYLITSSCIIACTGFIFKLPIQITILIIVLSYLVKYMVNGMYYVLIAKYLSNFTNEEIDSKIYTTQIFFNNLFSATTGIIASIYLDKVGIVQSMITYGILFGIIFTLITMYMKNKIGLSPEEYSKEEIKYSRI